MITTAADDKAWATAQARLALGGFCAYRIAGEDGQPLYIVNRWAWDRQLTSLDQLQQFVERVAPLQRAPTRGTT